MAFTTFTPTLSRILKKKHKINKFDRPLKIESSLGQSSERSKTSLGGHQSAKGVELSLKVNGEKFLLVSISVKKSAQSPIDQLLFVLRKQRLQMKRCSRIFQESRSVLPPQ